MGKFSQIAQGTRARRTEVLPLVGARFDISEGKWIGPQDKVDLRALSEGEEIEVLHDARAYAKAQGGDAVDDDPIYQHAYRVFTLTKACVDVDSPPDAPAPYFESASQIFASAILGPDHIVYLHEQYRIHRDEVSPVVQILQPAEFLEVVTGIAKGEQSYFLGLRPGTLWNFTRTLASLHLASLAPKSEPGAPGESSPKSETSPSSADDEPAQADSPHTLRGP